jgi:hypothetical protein
MYFLCDPILFRGKYEKKAIVAKDVVGLQVGDSKNNRDVDKNEDVLIINQK